MGRTHILVLAVLAAAAVMVVSCDRQKPRDLPVIDPPGKRGQPQTPDRDGPTTPIKLEKPKVLGPTQPAVVSLPAKMAEPTIRVRLTSEHPDPPKVNARNYRGRVDNVRLANGNFVAINTLSLDDYLQGVLAKEMYNSWHLNALRSQAIAARTYGLFQIMTANKAAQWDVETDERSQMYAGIAGETAKAREAVAATRGQVLVTTHNNVTGIFCTFFSACSGGATQDPFEAWGDPSIAALSARSLGPVDDNCPRYTWPTMAVAKSDITRSVRAWGQRNDAPALAALGNVSNVVISKRNARTTRPTEITLTDSAGKTATMRAEEFRLALLYDPAGKAPKPLSSWFDIQDSSEQINLVNGRGHGHGIGMSQWGAQKLALQGKTHGQILAFFYPESRVIDAW